jgi:hypothetical protein
MGGGHGIRTAGCHGGEFSYSEADILYRLSANRTANVTNVGKQSQQSPKAIEFHRPMQAGSEPCNGWSGRFDLKPALLGRY